MKRALGVLAVAMALVLATGCEPTATIDAHAAAGCDWTTFYGKVTPKDATPKVVVQRTVGGKWVDWKWYESWLTSAQAHVITAPVDKSDGTFQVEIANDPANAARLSGSIHVRVRTNGGQAGPGFYVAIPDASCV